MNATSILAQTCADLTVKEPATIAALFPLGSFRITPGAIDALNEANQKPHTFLLRHLYGDWGDCCEEDAAATGAAIVVSSTWRSAPRIKEILAGWGVVAEVISITPSLSRWSESGIYVGVERGSEITKWLADNGDNDIFVILDDDADMGELLPNLIRTDSHLGLSEADADRAISKIKALISNATPYRCNACAWSGRRDELIWSIPRRYICPVCKSDRVETLTSYTRKALGL